MATDGSQRRLLGLAGLGFAVTGALAWLISPIAMPDEAAAVAAHYSDNRTSLILTSVVVVGGSALMAAWYVVLAALLARTSDTSVLVLVGVVCMAIQIAAVSVGFTIFAAVAYREPDPDTAQLATDVGWLLISLAGGPVTTVAIIAFALALRREGFGGPWLLPASVLAAGPTSSLPRRSRRAASSRRSEESRSPCPSSIRHGSRRSASPSCAGTRGRPARG